jgi:class 3 adenylate cyclase
MLTRESDRSRMVRRTIAWIAIIGLLFALISLLFLFRPGSPIAFWYFMSAPILLAAYRFGSRGAAILSILALFLLVPLWRSAGRTFDQSVSRLIDASVSPGEAQRLAAELASLSTDNPQTAALLALTGLALVMVGAIMLGTAVDGQRQTTSLLRRAFNQLRRFFSPQIVETIVSVQDEADLRKISARKEITILFADIRGFTMLSERLEPEETVRLLNEYFTAMTEEIFREDGTLDKYLGDGILAFFGDPISYPDHPERAFRVALAMQRRMVELRARWESQGHRDIGLGIGLSTGVAVVGNAGSPTRMEYTAVGTTVNIASRLCDLAIGGQILTNRSTFERVQDVVTGAPRDPVSVKGLARPVEIVEIIGPKSVDERIESPLTIP